MHRGIVATPVNANHIASRVYMEKMFVKKSAFLLVLVKLNEYKVLT